MRGPQRWIEASSLLLSAGVLFSGTPALSDGLSYRVRSDVSLPLNADSGWAGPEGKEVVVEADRPFRLRLESSTEAAARSLAVQVRRNGGEWRTLEAHDFPYPVREVDLDFSKPSVDLQLEGWRNIQGDDFAPAITSLRGERVLQVEGGGSGLVATRDLPWPAASELSLSVRFHVDGASGEAALLWGVVDTKTYHAARARADGSLEIVNLADGAEISLARIPASGNGEIWREIEIEAEDGRLEISLDGASVLSRSFVSNQGLPGIAVTPGTRASFAEMNFQGVARTPQVSIIASSGYAHGDATSDLLRGSRLPFVAGTGISLWEHAQGASIANRHTEFELPLVIRRYADGPEVSETGDLFEFRMVDADGTPASAVAIVRLEVPKGHLGGTFVETPGRIGPWQVSNGDLYFIMEPAETDNKFMMMKSGDGGRSWREIDGPNRPRTGDLEAVDSRLVGDRILILHQVTRSVRYHTFRTSDHPTHPDTWESSDEVAAKAPAIAQMATLAPLSDGRVVAVFLSDRLNYVVRAPGGSWSAPLEIDPGETLVNAGPQAVATRDDAVHLAYMSEDGRIWYRRLTRDGRWTPRVLLADGAGRTRSEYGAVLPLAYDEGTDRLTIAYRLADGSLWERSTVSDGVFTPARLITAGPVIADAVDSQQAGADIVALPGGPTALFIDRKTRSISSTSLSDEGWSAPVVRIDGIEGSWVRGHTVLSKDGTLVYGIVYDAGSGGGTGMNRYAELPLAGD